MSEYGHEIAEFYASMARIGGGLRPRERHYGIVLNGLHMLRQASEGAEVGPLTSEEASAVLAELAALRTQLAERDALIEEARTMLEPFGRHAAKYLSDIERWRRERPEDAPDDSRDAVCAYCFTDDAVYSIGDLRKLAAWLTRASEGKP